MPENINLKQIEKNNYYTSDITQKDNVEDLFKKVNPDVVVHTAAYTNVDGCEKDKDTAFSVNVQGTKNIAESVEEIGAKLVYVSTDYVFNGDKGLYNEDDVTDPIDFEPIDITSFRHIGLSEDAQYRFLNLKTFRKERWDYLPWDSLVGVHTHLSHLKGVC